MVDKLYVFARGLFNFVNRYPLEIVRTNDFSEISFSFFEMTIIVSLKS